jgi:ribose/xylose/arabinose/galactoside ABC-type transport system permease subunit
VNDASIPSQVPTSTSDTAAAQDERITYRGPARRWLISPEIGALIGAIVVWAFLWGNGQTFGTAGTTLNWLDVAAPYGIMATAVALLMIGGEFDLSAGVMTGASAMIIGLISRFFMGEGVHIGWAILLAFAAAGAIGFFNGYLVVRTGLPSFIITLASFFVVRGLMLVLSKRLADKVYVDQIIDQRGALGFKNWIAHEWRLSDFGARDPIFFFCVIVGSALFIIGLLEQAFQRGGRDSRNSRGLLIAVIGIAAGLGGFAGLHRTDGVNNNVLFGALAAAGVALSVIGIGMSRYDWRPSGIAAMAVPRQAMTRLGLGVAAVVITCLLPIPFDRGERRAVLTWIADGLRPVVAIAAALVGGFITARSLRRGAGERVRATGWIRIALFSIYGGLITLGIVVSALQLTTVQALRAMGMLILGAAGIALLLNARSIAGKADRRWHLIIGVLTSVALVVIGLVCRVDSGATRFREVLPTAMVIGAALVLANSVLEFVLVKRTVAEPTGDRLSRRLQLTGALLIVVGCAIRLLYTNFTAAQAAARKAAGDPVPQNVLRQTVLWWILVAGVGAYVLAKTKWGNWVFAVGGNRDAARAVGVPADGVKIGLFVVVALCGALAGTLIALRYGTVQANQGIGLEFEYIIAAVVGGCLMTGGYGSVIGASLGAAILAMSTTGFQTVSGWNADGRFAFLGGVLLVAVLVNTYVRKKASEAR